MSQLKNYFGMRGSDKFTKEHLAYAKAHYVDDTGMGMQIQPFLDAITADTEPSFIEIINSIGI